jgi:glycosyltransferase involved in cell wall biosynthesis
MTWRGGEQQSLYLASGLQKRNIPQAIIGQPGSELEKRAVNMLFFPVKMRGEWDIFCIRKILKILRQHPFQIIHAHTAKAHSIALIAKFFRPDLKLIVSRRVDFSVGNNFFSKIKYTTARNNMFLTVSNAIRNVLVKDGVDPEKVITVYSGIDLKRFNEKFASAKLKKEFNISPKTIILGNVAALVDHKDQATLLKSISLIPCKFKIKLLIIGEGELETKLKKLANDLNLNDRVLFTGFRKDIPELLAMMDIFIITSKEEGLGTSVLDAMASGLPVVSTRGGGLGEMIEHGQGGFLTAVKDSVRIAEFIEKLLIDKKLRESFGKFNLQSVKRFSIENTIEKTIEIYKYLGLNT